ncbi:MAG TPA: ferritin-like domain-containing protein [Opitutaceae bacterium]|jgi:ferritin-like metal-binding protein YciE|nr:ferritin-like domain-containing protein [Opitutaceae bacterium]
MSKIKNLEELLVDELKDLYSAETQLIKALPKMAEAASSPELSKAFQDHLQQTRGHAERLVQALGLLGESEGGKTCHAMKGLIDEGSEAVKVDAPDSVRDADLIGAAQRVEHYEMAAYGCARAFALKLGKNDIADLLQLTLREEGDANKKLTAIAETVNDDAFAAADSMA